MSDDIRDDYPGQTKAANEAREYYLKLHEQQAGRSHTDRCAEGASPRPWSQNSIESFRAYDADGGIAIDAKYDIYTIPQVAANIGHAIACVNAHDALVEAMKDILDAAGALDCGSALPFALIDAIKDARKAFPALAQSSGNPGQVKGASNAG